MPDKLTPEVVDQAPEVTSEDVFDQEVFLKELADLSPLAYDKRRQEAAKLIGVRISTLDVEVAARRTKRDDSIGHSGITLDAPEPCAESVDGAELLDDLVDIFKRYLVLPLGAAVLLALWVVVALLRRSAGQLCCPLSNRRVRSHIPSR